MGERVDHRRGFVNYGEMKNWGALASQDVTSIIVRGCRCSQSMYQHGAPSSAAASRCVSMALHRARQLVDVSAWRSIERGS